MQVELCSAVRRGLAPDFLECGSVLSVYEGVAPFDHYPVFDLCNIGASNDRMRAPKGGGLEDFFSCNP